MNKFTKVLLSLPLLLGTVACSSSSFSVKSTQGYTFEFEKDNITTEIVKETKTGQGVIPYWGHYWITKVGDTHGPSAEDVYVTANGTWTDLAGNTSHFSEKVLCKTEAHVLYGREGAGPQKHNRPATEYGARFDGRSMKIEARYQNENSVVCQAARHYNLI